MVDRSWSKRAYLIEFHNNNVPEAAFTFAVPPESEEFTYPQRIAETKTFGKPVIEDYGNDTVRIVLSGSTVNEELKYISKSNFGYEFLSGEDEIFLLQRLIDDYGKKDKLGKKVTVYCLSSQTKGIKWWDVAVESLQIRRSKDRPIAYTYTLTMLGYSKTKEKKDDWLSSFENTVNGWITNILKGADWLAGGMDYLREALDYIARIKSLSMSFMESLRRYVDIVNGYIGLTTSIVKSTLNLAETTIRESERITIGSGLDVLNEVMELNEAVVDMVNYVRNFKEELISQDFMEQYGKTAREIGDTWRVIAGNMERDSANVVATTKMECSRVSYSVLPGRDGGNDRAIVVYGSRQHRASEADTWDRLAMEYLGDPGLGQMVAMYNNSGTLDAGDIVNIPIINRKDAVEDNLVYPMSGEIDNYGRDLALASDGDMAGFYGDLMPTSGQDTLAQGIESRLNTAVDTRIRLLVYGIRASVGEPGQAQNFIVSSVNRTLLEEPRIRTVEKVSYRGDGDDLHLSVVYTDINGTRHTYGGKF